MTNTEIEGHDFRQVSAERIMGEMDAVRSWYEKGLERFGEMTVEKANLTDGDKWSATLAENGEVDNADGAFFTLTGQTITLYKEDGSKEFGWTQPGLLQKESTILMPTREGEMPVKTSGFVGIIFDADSNVLLSLAQEPFAQTPKRVLIRTPFQTSAAKLQKLFEGERQFDPALYDLLSKFGEENDIRKVFSSGALDLFPLPYADANRIQASNTGFALRITDPVLHEQLTLDGTNRWFSPPEVSYITRAGLLNGHTAGAYLAAQSSF